MGEETYHHQLLSPFSNRLLALRPPQFGVSFSSSLVYVRVFPYCDSCCHFAAAQPKNGSATEPVALTIDGRPALQDELSGTQNNTTVVFWCKAR
jgi:hypothetical protein